MNDSETNNNVIGIDIGATTTRVGLVAFDAQVLARRTVATPDSEASMRQWLTTAIDELLASHEVHPVVAVGLAVPGLVESGGDTITRCVALPYLEGTWLSRVIASHTQLPVTLTTDVDAATWAEWRAMATAPDRFVHLRLGTGVGLGFIMEGYPRPVEAGRVTHASVLVVDDRASAAPCPCGLTGCVELVAGSRAITSASRLLGFDGLEALQQACDQSEPAAIDLVDTVGHAVAHAVGNITQVYRPEVLVVGGGVMAALPVLFERTVAVLRDALPLTINPAQLGDDAGIIGAAALALAIP